MRVLSIVFALFAAAILPSCGNVQTKLDTPPPPNAVKVSVNEISPTDAVARTQAAYSQFVDVRTPEEYAAGHAARAINIPLADLPKSLDRLERNEPVYLICQSGRRSKEAGEILSRNGFNWVFSIKGGTSEWSDAGMPME